MGAQPILRDIWQQRRQRWGEEDDGILFEPPGARLDVFIYRPTTACPHTRFATIGMAAKPLPGTSTRAELHLARRGSLPPAAEHAIATQLANLAFHPWATNSTFDWGHVIGVGKAFPGFAGCDAAFFSGPLENGGWDHIDTGEGKVRILNVVPITDGERREAREMEPIAFITGLMGRADIYSDRPS